MSRIIGISGGKGGTGKSTVATALAFELAKNKKVLLADMDVGCPNDHLLLGVELTPVKEVMQRIPAWDMDRCTKCGLCGEVCKFNAIISIPGEEPLFMENECNGCGACVIKCPVNAISWDQKKVGEVKKGSKHGIELLSGELKINEIVSERVIDEIKNIIKGIKEKYEYIIFDTAAGTHSDVMAAIEDCDKVIAVSEPTPLGANDLLLITELLTKMNKKFDVVLNRYEGKNDDLITKVVKKYNKKVIAKIPYDRQIVTAYSEGKPITHPVIKEIIKNI